MELLDKLLKDIPAVAKADAAITIVRKRMSERPLPQNVFAARQGLVNAVLNAINTGAPIPDDIGRRSYEVDFAKEIWKAELEVLNMTLQRLQGEREEGLRAGAKDALVVLKSHLAEVLSEARALLANLKGVSSAQEAVSRSPEAAAAWSSLGRLARRYVEIRDAQKALFIKHTGGDSEQTAWVDTPGAAPHTTTVAALLNVVGEVRNYGEIRPDWLIVRRTTPDVERNPRAFQFGDIVTHFHTLLTTPNADIWLPTVTEAAAAYADAWRASHEYERQCDMKAGRIPNKPSTRMSERETDEEIQVHQLAEQLRGSSTSFMAS